jgi:bacteriorhodopsin
MLVGFIVFFKYLKDPSRNIRWVQSVKEEYSNIIKIVLANGLMLLLGYLAEVSIIDKYVGVTLGFIPFAYVFKVLYADYAKGNTLATTIFYISFLIWSLYGVGAVLPFAAKNTMYNILDLFAKNGYGLFLYFYLKSLAESKNQM